MKFWQNYIVLQGIREMKRGKRQCIAICFLCFLSTAIFTGLNAALWEVQQGFQQQYEENQGYDLKITSSLPLDEALLQSLEKLGLKVEGSYESDIKMQRLWGEYPVRAYSYDKENQLNQMILLEGAYPENPQETLVTPEFLADNGLNIGDMVVISPEYFGNPIQISEFTIVGMGYSPLHLSSLPQSSKLGSLTSQIFFHPQVFMGDYDAIYLHYQGENPEKVEILLEEFTQQHWEDSKDSWLAPAQEKWDNAEENLRIAMENAQVVLDEINVELQDLEAQIALAWAEGQDPQDIALIEAEYQRKIMQIQSIQENLEESIALYRYLSQQAQRDYEQMLDNDWAFTTENTARSLFQQEIDTWERFATISPILFYLLLWVISLVSLSQMLREQRSLLGGLRAMGYHKWEISLKYLVYILIMGIISTFAGNFFGIVLVPQWVHGSWQEKYYLGEYTFYFHAKVGIQAVLYGCGLLFASAFLPCLFLIRGEPSTLMRPKAPVAGKRILLERSHRLWSELNFNQKVAVRSLFRHKFRLFLQITSVGFSTAFVVLALGLQETYPLTAQRQYQEIYRHTTEIYCRNQVTEEEFLQIQGVFSEYGLQNHYVSIYHESMTLSGGEGSIPVELYVFEDADSLEQVLNLRLSRLMPYNMPETGVVIPKKVSDYLGIPLGDRLSLAGALGVATPMVTGLAEQYHEHRIYMTAAYYFTMFGEEAEHNGFFLTLPENLLESSTDLAEFELKVLRLEGTNSLLQHHTALDYYTGSNNLLNNTLTAFFLGCCILVYLVLYQLNDNHLVYRRQELVTLKILGLYDKELSAYVYRENMIYSFFAVVLGMVLGQNIHRIFVTALETPYNALYRGVSMNHYFHAAGITTFIVLIVNVQAHFRIKKMKMAEEMKNTE